MEIGARWSPTTNHTPSLWNTFTSPGR